MITNEWVKTIATLVIWSPPIIAILFAVSLALLLRREKRRFRKTNKPFDDPQ